MKTQKNSDKAKLGLKVLERAALASAYAGANSACAFIYHDAKKPKTLNTLKKI